MSCQLDHIAKLNNIQVLRNFMQPVKQESKHEDSGELDWQESDWGWGDSEGTNAKPDNATQSLDEEWLQSCEVSVSPLADLMVFACNDKLAVLQSSCESGQEGQLDVLWKGVVTEFPKESITCSFCLPLMSYKQSSTGGPEWTCVLLGFNTGHIRAYTETGTKIMDQMLHNEAVMSIKCRTYSPSRYPGSADLHEELSILYETVLVTLDGFGLFQTLRACKNQVALAAASGTKPAELPHLGYKKWGLKEQLQANNHISVGSYTPNPFDQMQTASLAGFGEIISPVPPTSNVYVTTGDSPYVGFYHAIEGETHHVLSNLTEAAGKLLSVGASALISWGGSFLGKKSLQQPIKTPAPTKTEPALPVFPRYCLYDKRRIGRSMALSPYGTTAAIADSLGRVLLVNMLNGAIKRVWKGYRNAQVGWTSTREADGQRRCAQVLLIYAPRRGLLEAWLCEHGPRVGAFNVGKDCRLIYPGCSLLGVNSATYRLIRGKTCSCLLVNAAGEVSEVIVPFHLALSDANSKHGSDQLILKQVKALLKKWSPDSSDMDAQLWNTMRLLKLPFSFQQAVERLLMVDHLSSISALNIIDKLVDHLKDQFTSQDSAGGEAIMNVESRLLVEYCASQKVLTLDYSAMCDLLAQSDQNSAFSEPQKVDWCDVHPKEEVISYLGMKLARDSAHRVSFAADARLSLAEFLSYFEYKLGHHATPTPKQLSTDQQLKLGKLLLAPYIQQQLDLIPLKDSAFRIGLTPSAVQELLLRYYLRLLSPTEQTFINLLRVLKLIYNLEFNQAGESQLATVWWQRTREACEESVNFVNAMHIALAGRSICLQQTAPPQLPEDGIKSDPREEDDSWEYLTLETVSWNALIKHLEELSALNLLLSWKPNKALSVEPMQAVSVKDIKQGNKGLIGELVGRWSIANKLTPDDIRQFEKDAEACTPLSLARSLFPLSLSMDSILTNGAWESAASWNKDPESLTFLRLAVDYISSVDNGRLRHGVCCLIWRTYLLKRISALASLIEKVGKVPKDRLCKKEIGLDTAASTEFMAIVCNFMDVFMQANCDFSEPVVYRMEHNWEGEVGGSHSLLDVSCQQRETNYKLLHLHSLLIRIIYAVMVFNVKSIKIMSLFDHNSLTAFFKELNTYPYLSNEGKNEIITSNRRVFLMHLLHHAVEKLQADVQTSATLSSVDRVRRPNLESTPGTESSEAWLWPKHIVNLAEAFGLEVDFFRRTHTTELFRFGQDRLGLEVALTVSDQHTLCKELLDICGMRLAFYLFSADQESSARFLSEASPTLVAWLKEKDYSQLKVPNVPTAATCKLLMHVIRGIDSKESAQRYAEELYSLVSELG